MNTAYCFDLDGTLTRQELLPLIASSVGLDDEISALTQATIEGLLPFDKSFKLRVKLLKDAPLNWIHAALDRHVAFDQDILDFIVGHADQSFVVTGNLDLWVKPVLDKLGIRSFTSVARLDKHGQLDGIESILNKGDAVRSLRSRFDRIVTIGEGMNDIPMFECADWRIAYGGVHKPNKELVRMSDFVTYDGKALCRLLGTL